jgi:hypothetical protein
MKIFIFNTNKNSLTVLPISIVVAGPWPAKLEFSVFGFMVLSL